LIENLKCHIIETIGELTQPNSKEDVDMVSIKEKMSRLKCLLFFITLIFLIPSPLSAQDFDRGVETDERGVYDESLQELRQHAEQGDAEAQAALGSAYAEGHGVLQDYEEATKWYKRAANQGYAKAQLVLGMMYHKGYGTLQDYEKAAKWYKKAAEQGVAQAQYGLGIMYYHGQSVPQDYEKASKWHRMASDQGYANAQIMLGGMYALGHGVDKDFVKAHKWFNIAASQGKDEARKQRDSVAEILESDQIAEAQRLSREWVEKQRNKIE